jgi:phosphoribosylaminoimidazole-succinocarboxamide synthase
MGVENPGLQSPAVKGPQYLRSGKVREIFEIDGDTLLIVASDRVSAYDVVLPDPIPDKGRVLTGLSLHWFALLDTPNHLLGTDVAGLPEIPGWEKRALAGRSMVVRRAEVVPVECVVRGYLYGSSWREYAAGGGPTTDGLPSGLRQGDRLAEPVFTPATKAHSGHDENITEQEARRLFGDDVYEELRRRSIDIYVQGSRFAESKGILLADTKFEFGFCDGELILVDEVLTPDSSRYWPAERWRPGGSMPSYDKQFIRDALDDIGWDHSPPAPSLPPETIERTAHLYKTCFEILTDKAFADYLEEVQNK